MSTTLNVSVFVLYAFTLSFSAAAGAQATTVENPQPSSSERATAMPDEPSPQENSEEVTIRNTPVHILKDQAAIWTSPLRIRVHDLEWLVPLAAASGASIATDHHVMASVVSHDPSFNNTNLNVSNALIGGMIAAPVAFYGFGHFRENAHARETGILGGEALVDGVVVEQGMKLIFWRERPAQDNARGLFFQKGARTDSSLPSSHSVLAWSAAAVIAEEYPSRWSQLGVYSLATGVSVTRVLGQEHFPTDVLVGSAAGWLIGHYVYRAHHKHTSTTHR
jgi:hypothetical protein